MADECRSQVSNVQAADVCSQVSGVQVADEDNKVRGVRVVDENGAVRRVPVVDESSLSEESSSDENGVENSGSEKVDVMAWSEYYALGKGHYRTVWQNPVRQFYKYLLNVEGGSLSSKQALIHTCHVHMLLDNLNKNNSDASCLLTNNSLDIWDVFCAPRLKKFSPDGTQ